MAFVFAAFLRFEFILEYGLNDGLNATLATLAGWAVMLLVTRLHYGDSKGYNQKTKVSIRFTSFDFGFFMSGL